MFVASFRAICARQMDRPILVPTRHGNAPGIAADFAILNEAAVYISLDVDLQLLAAKRARHQEFIRHLQRSYCRSASER